MSQEQRDAVILLKLYEFKNACVSAAQTPQGLLHITDILIQHYEHICKNLLEDPRFLLMKRRTEQKMQSAHAVKLPRDLGNATLLWQFDNDLITHFVNPILLAMLPIHSFEIDGDDSNGEGGYVDLSDWLSDDNDDDE